MVRCEFCKKKSSVPIECKACKLNLCTRCIDMSIHNCKNIIEYCYEKRKSLENILLENKTPETKKSFL